VISRKLLYTLKRCASSIPYENKSDLVGKISNADESIKGTTPLRIM
jgi:hypothetical protein